jgi:hypothetical protein
LPTPFQAHQPLLGPSILRHVLFKTSPAHPAPPATPSSLPARLMALPAFHRVHHQPRLKHPASHQAHPPSLVASWVAF